MTTQTPPPDYDILTFGSLTVDMFLRPSEMSSVVWSTKDDRKTFFVLPAGEKLKVDESIKQCGGGTANAALGLAKLGLHPAPFGVIGDQGNHLFVMAEFEKLGVPTHYLTVAKGEMTSLSVVLNSADGERTVLHKRTTSPNFNASVLQGAPGARAVYCTHLYPGSQDILHEVPAWKARSKGQFFWNPGKTQFHQGFDTYAFLLQETDILLLNREESEYFTGLKAHLIPSTAASQDNVGTKVTPLGCEFAVDDLWDVRHIAKKFLEAGVKKILITDGSRGAQLFTEKSHLYMPSSCTKRIDTLGAGDAFSVGVIGAHLLGQDEHTQMTWGAKNANSVIQYIGAQTGQLQREEIEGSK